MVAVWVVYRHAGFAWLLQDTFAIFVCCQFVQVLRLNSIKVCVPLFGSRLFASNESPHIFSGYYVFSNNAGTLLPVLLPQVSYALLVSFMVYDIFMVFISPAIFKSSVMVTVAQVRSILRLAMPHTMSTMLHG